MSENYWLEVSLVVDGELAEAVAEVMARFTPSGVVIESTEIIPDPNGAGHPSGPLRVCSYLPADADQEDTRQRLEEALWYLSRITPLPSAQFRLVQEVNWVDAWKEHYHPILVGKRQIIIPAWLEASEADRISIKIDPGMAFGTGTHPTTQLCMALAETWLKPGKAIIDVGCGSGILSVAALKLGASHALGVDIEIEAIEAAHHNANINMVETGIELGLGSVAEIRLGKFSLRQAPLVFANILAPIIIRLLEDGLGDLIQPGGIGIFSGILLEQEQDVTTAAIKHSLQLCERRQSDDWVALCFRSPQ